MQDFSGIAEKLIRAKENIRNLDGEIALFFEESDYPVLPENDRKLFLKAMAYHKSLSIPPRFSVLAGEVIHHLRSCFDHIVWHFSTTRTGHIEFPVFNKRPRNERSTERFEGKIEGVTDPNVLRLIKKIQPYNSPDPTDNPLLIIHNFDIVDKHKELVVCVSTGSTVFPIEMQAIIERYQREHPKLDGAQIAHQFKSYGTLKPCISFRNFGRREIHPVVPGLTELFNYTRNAVIGFSAL